jgi:hypothetical protein
MRRVIRRLRSSRGDGGAVLVWAAGTMVALLGAGAIVIDVGALYKERRELQNGADAAALAVAKDCAGGDCLDEYGTAKSYADDNANDGVSSAPLVCGDDPGLALCPAPVTGTDGADGWVKVDTRTLTDDGSGEIAFLLAPVLDAANVGRTVEASAVAAWGPVGSATTVPLIFSTCEFEFAGGSLDPPSFPSGEHVIHFHDNDDQDSPADCLGSPSGGDFAGGFGWLDAGGDCQIEIDADGWVEDEPGSFNPTSLGCNPTEWQDADVLLPLFDQTNGLNGNNGEYHVAGFVGFHITGYRFSGEFWNPPCGGSDRCIGGEFTEFVAVDGDFGGDDDYGARVVKMIG